MKSVPAAKFKEQCLALLDHVDPEGIVITKHGKPVAKLVRIRPETRRRKRFDPAEHRAWQVRLFGKRTAAWVDRALAESRADRRLIG